MRNPFKRRIIKTVSVFLLVNMAVQLLAPVTAYALTSGPSTPEVQTFTPAGTTDMVDLFTGKFGYNLPVFELPGPNGGYPFNLSYNGGISMDQEASWVGLGWNLGPGAINREVRGLPDDFNGDVVKYRHDMLPNSTIGVNTGIDFEVFGGDGSKGTGSFSLGVNLYYNSNRGVGLSLEPGVGYHKQNASGTSAGFGLKLKMDSQEGVGLSPSLSLSCQNGEYGNSHSSFTLGIGYNSKRGLTDLGYGFSITKDGDKVGTIGDNTLIGANGSMSFAHTAFAPSIDMEMTGYNVSFMTKAGGELKGFFLNGELGGYYTTQSVKNANVDVSKKAYGYLSAEQVDQNTGQDVFDFNREKDGLVRDETPNLGIPSMTHDVYNISGQGIGGSFRPYRPYISTMFDPHSSSLIGGGSLGVDLGFGAADFKVGVELTVNVSRTTANEATATSITNGYGKDEFLSKSNPQINHSLAKDYETYYFKCTGEPTTQKKSDYAYMNYDKLTDLSGAHPPSIDLPGRKARNSSVQEYRNYELKSTNYLQEFASVGYYDFTSPNSSDQDLYFSQNVPVGTTYQKVSNYTNYTPTPITDPGSNWRSHLSDAKQKHIGGYTVLQPDGSRYVYGLPVYNTKQVDKHYSVTSIDPSTNKAWQPDINGSESANAASMLASDEAADRTFHRVHSTIQSAVSNGGSQEYLNRTELPPYTTSHMITSILGADYVDVDNNGPSDNDFGYWVKFNYVKVPQYNWKVPYIGANYSKGLVYNGKDDKASYQYGEKEVFYLATAETKTHIAIFDISERKDAGGITGEFNSQSAPSAKSYKLNRIRLYSKLEYYDQSGNTNSNAQPISTANFEYSYELCPDSLGIPSIPNFISNPAHEGKLTASIVGEGATAIIYGVGEDRPGKGKLTLKKVWFTYERSTRGALTPYQFHYSANNPRYEHKNQDRWGTYKEVAHTQNYDYPYAIQDSVTAAYNAQAWCLTDIYTPSGSHINVTYESSDYGYVQNKTAGQMFRIARTYIDDVSQPDNDGRRYAKLYSGSSSGPGYPNAGECRKVYFDLEGESYDKTYSEGQGGDIINNAKILNKYVADLLNPEGKYQLYYKVFIDMRSQSEPVQEYVSGYAEFDPKNVGFDDRCITGTGSNQKITRGYIYLDMPWVGRTVRDFVPFSVAGWQFFKSAMSEYVSDPGKLGTPAGQQMSVSDKALELVSGITGIRDLFTTYYGRASRHTWASRIDLNHSWIRLCTPNKTKYGGGHRVSKITIESNWDHNADGQTSTTPTTYGVTYDYHDYANPLMDPVTGKILTKNNQPVCPSSGVAQYEPSVGGDEISLRYARTYAESIPLKTANNTYFEYPVNESYFPGPTVGYSMVTVKSLATENQLKNLPTLAGVSGTGETVHEFYTARDFPVITEMGDISKRDLGHIYVPIPLIGEFKFDEMKAHQGYKIEVNDMHGKPKKVSYYGQDMHGKISGNPSTPLSYVKYSYLTGALKSQNSNIAQTLSSAIGVMTGEGVKKDITNTNDDYEMGVEYDCFTDMRHSATRSGTGGLSINLDFMYCGIPLAIAIPWPSLGYSQTEVNLGVTNKIIRRTGILKETEAYDGNSRVVTDNLYYDAQTGRSVLSTVTNDFDAPIYKYNIPAYWIYGGMDAAYKNFGVRVSGGVSCSVQTAYSAAGEASAVITVPDASLFVEGDEFTFAGAKGTVLRKINGTELQCTLYAVDGTTQIKTFTSGTNYDLRIIRSGRRNLLNTDAGNITALQDPTIRTMGSPVVCNTNSLSNYYKYPGTPLPLPAGFVDFVKEFLVTDRSNGNKYFTGLTGFIPDLTNPCSNGCSNTGTCMPPCQYLINNSNPGGGGYPAGGGVWASGCFVANCNLNGKKTQSLSHISANYPSVYTFLGKYFNKYVNNTNPNLDIESLPADWENPSVNNHDNLYKITIEGCGGDNIYALHFAILNTDSKLPKDGCHFFINPSVVSSGVYRDIINSRVIDISMNDPYTIKVTFVSAVGDTFTQISTPLYDNLATNPILSDSSSSFCCDAPLFNQTALNCQLPDTPWILNKVLSATTVKFQDIWPQDFNQYRGSTDLTTVLNPYANGAAGTWRPYETYTYVTDRKQGLEMASDKLTATGYTASKVNLSRDGIFDSMPMFNWYNPSFNTCFPKWRLTNTITQYSPYGYEAENMDILKNFSTALYGYDGKLPIAVASNTSFGEGAFEGFEEYKGNSNVTMPVRTTGNFTIVNDMTGFNSANYQKVPIAFGNGNMASVNMDFNAFIAQYGNSISGNVLIQAEAGGDGLPYENVISTATSVTMTSGVLALGSSSNSNATVLQFSDGSGNVIPDFQYGAGARCWTGYVYIPKASSPSGNYPGISFVSTRAHTGKVSMKVSSATAIPQLDMKLLPNKQYVIGGWVSLDMLKYAPIDGTSGVQATMVTYSWGIKVGYGTATTPPTSWYNINTIKSKSIDGWVRLEDENYVTPASLPAGSVMWLRLEPLNGGIVYIDDLRLHPFTGNMKSYVYDPQNYKLKAELDNNNYATFYSYDAAGNLFQIKRETEEGIITVQESRSHIKEN